MMKTMTQNKLKRIVALFLVAAMFLSIAVPCFAASTDETIYINTAEDLVELSKNCSYDKWSIGKTIILSNDISLKGVCFEPIPCFSGAFDGQGYTISDLEIDGSYYPAGLFGTVKEKGIIKNLNVTGSVIPDGKKEAVGGVAGINYGTIKDVSFTGVVCGEIAVGGIVGLNKETGIIENAFSKGNILGEHGTGGIAGRNLGVISSGRNDAFVNNTSGDSTINLEDLNINFLQSLYSLNSADMLNAFTDSGGIAGYSSGMIIACKNKGTVGYDRVGYNAGGIVGRNTGYVQESINTGDVLGRKDIGGIVGQVEPFIDVEVDPTDLVAIDEQLHTLYELVDTTGDAAEKTKNDVGVHLDKIREYMDDITVALDKLGIETEDPDVDMEMPEDVEVPEGELERPEFDEFDWPELDGELDSDEQVDWDEIKKEVSTAREAIREISTALKGINEELELADQKFTTGSKEVEDGLEAINNQANLLSDSIITMVDNVKNLTVEDFIKDTSNENIENVIYGKVTDCINQGAIQGDYNVGGIAGIMSIEYELDPEDDTSMDISWEERKQYEVKAVVIKCINQGMVNAKKDNVAGICGQVDIGVIANCLSFGNVVSENGSYVGGIAGIANTTVMNCIANCGLSGKNYVGGIIGCGLTDEEYGSSVSNCYSLVKITDCKQFEGAIAGVEEGIFEKNYFVSNELQGINRISYAGKAEPISYDELLLIPNLPDELKGFTLSFVADDKVIKSIDFNYGDSFGADIYPEVPKKEGYDGMWDITDLSNLCFDTVVTAEYTLYVTALKSDVMRDNERPVFIIEGNFSNEDVLSATSKEITEELRDELGLKVEAEEYWHITFSDDGQKRHSLRFLPDEKLENAKLYMKENGVWVKVKTEDFGSYKTFQVVGNEVELAIIPIRYEIISYVLIILLVIIAIATLVGLEIKKHTFSNVGKKMIGKIGKKKLKGILLIISIMFIVFGIGYLSVLPQIRISAELLEISADVFSAKNHSMKLDMTADIGDNHIELNPQIYVINDGKQSVVVLEENEHSFYLSDGVIYLENEKGYLLGETDTGNVSLLEQIRKLYKATKVEKSTELDNVIYSIIASGDDAKGLFEVLVPFAEEQIASVGDTTVRIIVKDNILKSIEVEGYAKLKNSAETEIVVSAVISDIQLDKEKYVLPDNIAKAIEETEKESLSVVGEDIYRLLLAWGQFKAEEKEGNVRLNASCGPININTELDWSDIAKGLSNNENASNMKNIPNVICEICINGEFTIKKLGESHIYQLEMNDETMNRLAEMLVPELKNQAANFTKAVVKVEVVNNEIQMIDIELNGSMKVLFSEIDTSIETEIVFN